MSVRRLIDLIAPLKRQCSVILPGILTGFVPPAHGDEFQRSRPGFDGLDFFYLRASASTRPSGTLLGLAASADEVAVRHRSSGILIDMFHRPGSDSTLCLSP